MRSSRIAIGMLVVVALAASASASAQSRGQGHMAGVVKDESGQNVEGVQVKAVKAGEQDAFTDKTNKKGEWAINGLAGGQWNVDFSKDGYETKKITVPLDEMVHVPPMNISIKKAVVKVDPNAEIKGDLQKAAPLLEAGKYTGSARDLRRYPAETSGGLAGRAAHRPHLRRREQARRCADAFAEGAGPRSEQHRGQGPHGVVLSQQGKTADAQKYLDTIDMSQIKDPVVFLNQGINLINQGKAADALPIFEKIVTAFPTNPEGYYYRGRCDLALGKFPEAKADLQKFVAMPGADASEVEQAKKILEQLK